MPLDSLPFGRVTIRQRLIAESMLWHHDEREGHQLMALCGIL